jgi:hypothetical protein
MLRWDDAVDLLIRLVPILAIMVASIQIARKAGYGTGMVVLISISPPVGLLYLAFAEWPIYRRRRTGRLATQAGWIDSQSGGAKPQVGPQPE